MKNRFYLACLDRCTGSNLGFHATNGHGYTTNIADAHVYNLEEAQNNWNLGREEDLPLSADHVDALTVWKVDHQYIPNTALIPSDEQHFVAYKERKWDGNDVYWLSQTVNNSPNRKTEISTNFSKAVILSRKEVLELDVSFIVIPYMVAYKATRRTFDKNKIHERTMVQGAGLKMPVHVKRARRRSSISNKTRMNCPGCGQFVYQDDPNDFMGCPNTDCIEWRA